MKRLFLAAAMLGALLLTACGGADATDPTDDPATEAAGDEAAPSEGAVVEDPNQTAGGAAAGMCILAVEYEGNLYVGATVEDAPAQGDSLGEGTFPPCNDTGGDAAAEDSGEPVEIFALDGVDPADAVGAAGRTEIFVREGVDPNNL